MIPKKTSRIAKKINNPLPPATNDFPSSSLFFSFENGSLVLYNLTNPAITKQIASDKPISFIFFNDKFYFDFTMYFLIYFNILKCRSFYYVNAYEMSTTKIKIWRNT